MSLLAGARLFVRVGVDFENGLMPRLEESLPQLRIIDSRRASPCGPSTPRPTRKRPTKGTPARGPTPRLDGPPAGAAAGAHDPRRLIGLDPEGRESYERGYAALTAELEALHAEIAGPGALPGRELFVFHPAFGYFADAYGLRQVAVETGGKEPAPGSSPP